MRRFVHSSVRDVSHSSHVAARRPQDFRKQFATASGSSRSSAKQVGGYVLFGGLVAGTATLGTWQAQRYYWKVDKVDKRKTELRRPPAPLAHILDEAESELNSTGGVTSSAAKLDGVREMRRVKLHGVWDHSANMLIGRRGAPPGLLGAAPQGLATSPSGYYLCTALVLSEAEGVRLAGQRIVVNRGWLPAAVAEAKGWNRPTGSVVLTGLVNMRGGETKATFSPVNDPTSGTMLWLELPLLAKALRCIREEEGSAPILVDEVSECFGTNDGTQGNSTKWSWPAAKDLASFEAFPVMPETHAVYATTWYSLSTFGLLAAMRLLRTVPK